MSRWQIYEVTTDADGVDCYIKRGEIIRCGECKWYNCGACFRDDGVNNGRNADDFCSYGERNDNEF